MPHATLATLVLLLPLGAAVALLLVPPLRRSGRVAAALCIGATGVSLLCAIPLALHFGPGAEPLTMTWSWLPAGGVALATLGLHMDAVSTSMMVVVALVALCVQIYSTGYLATESAADRGRYFMWQSLFAFAMLGVVIAPNLLQLFICWELVGLLSYLLIGYYWTRPAAARAAVKAFWVTKFADIGLVLGLMVLYVRTGTFDFQATLIAGEGTLIAGLMFIAVMGKSAQFPLHIWLPDAMEGPTPVSALLHAATMVAAGVYLVVRAWPIFEAAPDVLLFMCWLGAFTALFAAVVACFQNDIKKVLAYSTCSQLGYMIAALGAGSMAGGYLHLTTHAAFKALLFLGAGSVIHAVHGNDLRQMGGLWARMKPTALLFIIGSLALAGVPPFAGFFSKDLILEELLAAGQWGPLLLALSAALLTAFYMTRVVLLAFFGAPSEASQGAHESPLSMLGPMALLALGAVLGGLLLPVYGDMAGAELGFHLSGVGALATGLGAAGVAAGWWLYAPARRERPAPALAHRLRAIVLCAAVDRSAEFIYRRIMNRFAVAIGWLDRYVIDGAINGSAYGVLRLAEQARRLQSGRVGDYLYAVVIGLILLAAAGVFTP